MYLLYLFYIKLLTMYVVDAATSEQYFETLVHELNIIVLTDFIRFLEIMAKKAK